MQSNKPVKIKELTYRYCQEDPHSQVLNSIELEVSKGELIILTGASGSGKTTLLTLMGDFAREQRDT